MLENLQFDFETGDPVAVRGTTTLVRLSGSSLDIDFVWIDPDDQRDRVATLKGKNLNLLLPRILIERQKYFTAGMECPRGCELARVVRRDWLSSVDEEEFVPPERNRVPPWIFCCDTSNARWYLDFLSLQSFGPSRLRGHRECRLQFASSLRVTCFPDEKTDLWGQFRATNLDVGTLNKVSVWGDDAYLGAGIGGARYSADRIVVEQKQTQSTGEWGMAPANRPTKRDPTRETGGMEI